MINSNKVHAKHYKWKTKFFRNLLWFYSSSEEFHVFFFVFGMTQRMEKSIFNNKKIYFIDFHRILAPLYAITSNI
jgi:hypothetical protein